MEHTVIQKKNGCTDLEVTGRTVQEFGAVKLKMYTLFLYMAKKQNHVSMRNGTVWYNTTSIVCTASVRLDWLVAQSTPAVMTCCKNYMEIRKIQVIQ